MITSETVTAWKDLTPVQINKFKREVCKGCEYSSCYSGNGDFMGAVTCDYSAITGSCRLCSPLECKERGFYLPRTRKRKAKAKRIKV